MPDITISLTVQDAQRAEAAIGLAKRLKDANGAPRAATLAESKAFVIAHLRNFVQLVEKKQTADAIVPTAFNAS